MSNVSFNASETTNPENAHDSGHADQTSENESFRLDTAAGSKQKRRRTSPRDHAILESAYQRNSKPDKDERLKLVQQVDLGEKEVQIWFQNRRQNDRRKSKPLLPHELIPHFRNGIPTEASSQLPASQGSQDDSSPRTSDLKAILNESDDTSLPTPAIQRLTESSKPSSFLPTPPSSFESPVQPRLLPQNNTSPLFENPSSASQLGRKRSHEEMSQPIDSEKDKDQSSRASKSLRRTSSFVRLAVNADGSVKVRVNDETTPSPPKVRAPTPNDLSRRRSSGLVRAQSDLASSFQFRDTSTAVKGVLGRSRDARTWEFYCDRDSRASLATRAEEAASGSAVSALGLLRAAGQRRPQALSPNPSKHNLRRNQKGFKLKPSLVRTQSSMARLQGSDGACDEPAGKTAKSDHRRRTSGSDSEKENWLPGTRDAVHDLRRTEPSVPRSTTLKEVDGPSRDRPLGLARSVQSNDREGRLNAANGEGKAVDMDCVQGLLSLSQGAWQ